MTETEWTERCGRVAQMLGMWTPHQEKHPEMAGCGHEIPPPDPRDPAVFYEMLMAAQRFVPSLECDVVSADANRFVWFCTLYGNKGGIDADTPAEALLMALDSLAQQEEYGRRS